MSKPTDEQIRSAILQYAVVTNKETAIPRVIKALRALFTQPEWIPVGDGELIEGKDYEAYGEDYQRKGEFRMYIARYSASLWGWSIPGIGGLNITHYRELPTPPEVG